MIEYNITEINRSCIIALVKIKVHLIADRERMPAGSGRIGFVNN